MKWTPGGRSADIEDRRGSTSTGRGGLKLGLGGVVVVGLLSLIFQRNFFADISRLSGEAPGKAEKGQRSAADPEEEKLVQFVSFVLDDIQKTWTAEFAKERGTYPRAKLVLFTGEVRSACGGADSATGPFYCPGDQKVYIDLSFYRDLRSRFKAPGDFAQAYVIAHEIGHHIQHVQGIEQSVRKQQRQQPDRSNELSVRMELQADCFAGMWAKSTEQRNLLEADDVDEALNCASAIGDDRLQQQARGRVNPETFTHGTSEQRARWFKRGMTAGSFEACDTFQTSKL